MQVLASIESHLAFGSFSSFVNTCFWLSWLAGHSFKPRHSFHSTRQHLTFLGPLIVFSTAVCKRPHSLFSSEALAFGVHSLDWQHLVQHLFLVFAAFGLNGASRICQCFASYHSLLWVHNLLMPSRHMNVLKDGLLLAIMACRTQLQAKTLISFEETG